MLPDKLLQHDPVDGFRWRSHEVSRIEGFSDAVFGFAVTLLIVSLEVPRTSAQLLETMQGFGAFLVTFIVLAGIWYAQFSFFRRYGLEDRKTVLLNLVLLFMVLFFVYPLKFVFGALLTNVHMRGMVQTPHGLERMIRPEHAPLIFAIFGAGFVAVFGVFLLLYRHALSQSERLGLNEFELFETRHTIRRMTVSVFIGMGYFLIGGANAMPHATAEERKVQDWASWGLIVVFGVLVAVMVRLQRHRARVRREWLARSAEAPAVRTENAPSGPGLEPMSDPLDLR